MGKTDGTTTATQGKDPGSADPEAGAPEPLQPIANPFLAMAIAWAIPGAGHAFLGRWGRALLFLALISAFAWIGIGLDGRLYTFGNAQRLLHWVAATGALGLGFPYLVLAHGIAYHGDPAAASYEYGTAFLITASLMNCLLILDVWDIARGVKD